MLRLTQLLGLLKNLKLFWKAKEMTDTIKAELVYYRIDVSRPEGRTAYAELCETLKEIPFETWVVQGRFPNGETNFGLHKFIKSLQEKLDIRISTAEYQLHSREIHLETKHLFEDQWNTVEGFRLHNKALFEWPALHIKEGYYIRQNPQMIAVLQGTAKCGYCRHQAPVGEKDFCDKCISSPYLEVSQLRLLRMEPIEASERRTGKTLRVPRGAKPLSEAELAVIMPRYVEAQTKLREQREAKLRADVEAEFSKTIELATIKHDGMLWMLDAGISTESTVFYPHTRTFTFGWRNPVSKEVKAELVEKLKEFPFKFEIK